MKSSETSPARYRPVGRVVPSPDRSTENRTSGGNQENEDSDLVKVIGEILEETSAGDSIKKRNPKDKEIKEETSGWDTTRKIIPKDKEIKSNHHLTDIQETVAPWTKANKKACRIKSRKMKVEMAKNAQKDQKGDSRNEKVVGKERLRLKLPQILIKQQEILEYQAAARQRIAQQDEALLEIDCMLQKLDEKEQKRNTKAKTKVVKPKLQRGTRIDSLEEENVNVRVKPVTYHDSLTDSLDRLLDDVEEYIDEKSNFAETF